MGKSICEISENHKLLSLGIGLGKGIKLLNIIITNFVLIRKLRFNSY